MNTLRIEPNLEKKTAKITGKVAVGELVSVSIDDVSSYNAESLRLRVFCAGRVISQYPAPDTTESFSVSGDDLTCEMKFDSVDARKMCIGRETPVLLVLEDIGDNATLYFTQEWTLKGWPGIDTEDEPTDFSVYAFPTLVTEWKSKLDTAKSAFLTHSSSTSNPHSVTKAQVGLGNVDNTADLNKPVSTATAAAIASEKSSREAADTAISADIDAEAATRLADDNAIKALIQDEEDRASGVESAISSSITEQVGAEESRAMAVEATLLGKINTEKARAQDAEIGNTTAIVTERDRAVTRENQIATSVSNEVARATAAETANANAILVEKERAMGVEAQLASIASGVMKLLVVSSLPSTGVEKTIYLVPASSSSEGNVKDEYLWVNNAWEKIGSTSVDLSQYAKKTDLDGVERIYNQGSLDVYVHKNETTQEGTQTTSTLDIFANLPYGLRGLSGKIPDGAFKEIIDELVSASPTSLKTGVLNPYVEISCSKVVDSAGGGTITVVGISGKTYYFSVSKDGITVESYNAGFGTAYTVTGGVPNNSGWAVSGTGIGYSSDAKRIGYYSFSYSYSSSGEESVILTKKTETADVPSVVSPSASAAVGSAASAKATGTALAGKVSIIGDTMTGSLRVDYDESTDTGADISKEGYSIFKDGDTVFAATDGGNVLADGDVTAKGKVVVGENDYNDGTMYGNGTITRESENGETVINLPDDGQSHDFPTKTSELENDSGFVTASDIPAPSAIANSSSKIDADGNVFDAGYIYDGGSITDSDGLVYKNCTKSGTKYTWTTDGGVSFTYDSSNGAVETKNGNSTGAGTNKDPFAGAIVVNNFTRWGVTYSHTNTATYDFPTTPTDRLAREYPIKLLTVTSGAATALDSTINTITPTATTTIAPPTAKTIGARDWIVVVTQGATAYGVTFSGFFVAESGFAWPTMEASKTYVFSFTEVSANKFLAAVKEVANV